jgi:membrane protease YdiL (CAAX protease family)
VTLLLAAAEPSKVPFYVAGSLLVVWAVALAAVGLTVPEFPYGKLGQRAVVLVSLLLAAAAVATAIATEK